MDNIEVVIGRARFTGPNTIDVKGRELRFRQALIATGASPVLPDIPGIDAVDLLTSETFWDLRTLPERLVVLGGGAIGCEIAQALARLGSAVTLVHRGPRILPKEGDKASAIIHAALIADGVDVRTNSAVTSVSSVDRLAGTFTLRTGETLPFDRVLEALGRPPNTSGLDLQRVGVREDDRGNIAVSALLRTSNPRICAAGDVTGLPQFTHHECDPRPDAPLRHRSNPPGHLHSPGGGRCRPAIHGCGGRRSGLPRASTVGGPDPVLPPGRA